jgi:hypothetical protein
MGYATPSYGGTILEDFELISDWSLSSNTVITTSTITQSGNAITLKNVDDSTEFVYIDKTGINVDISDAETFSLNLYVKDVTKVNLINNTAIKIYFGTGEHWSDYVELNTFMSGDYNIFTWKSGWNQIKWKADDLVLTGSPNLNAPFTKMRVRLEIAQNGVAEVTFDTFRKNDNQTPTIILIWDDGEESVYSKIIDYSEGKNIIHNIPVISDKVGKTINEVVGTLTYMTLEQLQEAYSLGHEIVSHTKTHPNLAEQNEATIRTELSTCRDYLINNGMPSGAYCLVYPYNSTNDTVKTVATEVGVKFARAGFVHHTEVPPFDPLEVGHWFVATQGTTTLSIDSFISRVIDYKTTGVIMGHGIKDVPDDPYFMSTENMEYFIDQIIASGVRTMKMSDWYNEYFYTRL